MASIIPLLVLLVVVGVAAFVGYSIYLWSNELADKASKKMEQKNMSFTKDGGLRVGVKDVNSEKEADKTQNVLVNVWNNAQFPNYKSSLGWNSSQKKPDTGSPSSSSRPSASRSGSSQQRGRDSGTTSGSSTLAPPAQKSSQRRSVSPVPGSFD